VPLLRPLAHLRLERLRLRALLGSEQLPDLGADPRARQRLLRVDLRKPRGGGPDGGLVDRQRLDGLVQRLPRRAGLLHERPGLIAVLLQDPVHLLALRCRQVELAQRKAERHRVRPRTRSPRPALSRLGGTLLALGQHRQTERGHEPEGDDPDGHPLEYARHRTPPAHGGVRTPGTPGRGVGILSVRPPERTWV
jgi:hypothetical protein